MRFRPDPQKQRKLMPWKISRYTVLPAPKLPGPGLAITMLGRKSSVLRLDYQTMPAYLNYLLLDSTAPKHHQQHHSAITQHDYMPTLCSTFTLETIMAFGSRACQGCQGSQAEILTGLDLRSAQTFFQIPITELATPDFCL